jgi:hypothetical protein
MVENSDALRAWQRLSDAPRKEMPLAWSDYLRVQVEWSRRQLEQLVAIIATKEARLKELIRDMNQHARHYARPTLRSQEAYTVLLDEAEAIDVEDAEVKGHRGRYQNNETRLGRR